MVLASNSYIHIYWCYIVDMKLKKKYTKNMNRIIARNAIAGTFVVDIEKEFGVKLEGAKPGMKFSTYVKNKGYKDMAKAIDLIDEQIVEASKKS